MTTNITGKMKIAIGKSIFTGAFCARSSACICRRWRKSAAWARRMPASGDPSWSDESTALANAIAFSLPDALGEAAHGRPPGLADPQPGQDPVELVRERPVVRLRQVADRGVEAHPGLDRDRELVDEVRQLGVDLGGPPSGGPTEEEAGQVAGGRGEDDREHDPPPAVGEREPREDAHDHEGDSPGHEELGGQAAGRAGAAKLRGDVVLRLLSPELQVDPHQQGGDAREEARTSARAPGRRPQRLPPRSEPLRVPRGADARRSRAGGRAGIRGVPGSRARRRGE